MEICLRLSVCNNSGPEGGTRKLLDNSAKKFPRIAGIAAIYTLHCLSSLMCIIFTSAQVHLNQIAAVFKGEQNAGCIKSL